MTTRQRKAANFAILIDDADGIIPNPSPAAFAAERSVEERVLVMPLDDDDFVPVTGGVELADDCIRQDVNALCDLKAASELDWHIVRLLTLHGNLSIRFRNHDLAALDEATKRSLLADINDLLGIKPLKTTGK